ncbi:MAG: helix-turn-helix transcriptional regulator [Bacteroidota bacterium]
MLFDPNAKSLILLFFVLHELVFALILWRKGSQEGNASDKWLSFLLLLCALYMAPWMLGKAGWYAQAGYRDFLLFIPFHQYFLFGPVMYFLTRSLCGEVVSLSKKELWHFIPAALYLLYSAVIAVTDLLILEDYYFYQDGLDQDFKPWYQIIGLASMIVYAVFSLIKYREFKGRIYSTVSFADSVRLSWLRDFLFCLALIIVLRGLFIVIFPEVGDWGFKWWYYLLFGLISYYLSLTGFMSSLRMSVPKLEALSSATKVYAESKVEAPHLDPIVQQVDMLFQESKMYADPHLTLVQLAKAVETNTSVLSRAINEKAGMNFNDFINSYRISAVKQSLQAGEMNHKTLVGIAMDHGFNSKSTFIRSFKKQEGVTPSEYYKSLTNL